MATFETNMPAEEVKFFGLDVFSHHSFFLKILNKFISCELLKTQIKIIKSQNSKGHEVVTVSQAVSRFFLIKSESN